MTIPPSDFKTLEGRSLCEQTKQRIVEAILAGRVKPGERLVETMLAEQLGVGRGPVREALMALEQEGFVVNTPRRGYTVFEATAQGITEIYSRQVLPEVGAFRHAMERFTAEDIWLHSTSRSTSASAASPDIDASSTPGTACGYKH